ncbi:MAG: hypothetical protein U0794_21290 [Isosphaeraceae bacterium]
MVLPVTALFYGTGVILYAYYQVRGGADPLASGQIRKADQILPFFVVRELPTDSPGFFIAAIYAASMSTISAGDQFADLRHAGRLHSTAPPQRIPERGVAASTRTRP